MKFGVFDQNDDAGGDAGEQLEQRLKLVERYDRLGFDYYHMSEHHGTPLSTTPSPGIFLAALSQRTKRLRFGPLVYLLPLHNPLRLAEEICMLDRLSAGRFEFGIGRGASPHETRYLNVDPDEAPARFDEAYTVIMQALTEGRVRFSGKYWQYDDVELSVRPVQRPHPPVWYAAASPETAVWPAQQGMHLVSGGPVEKIRAVTDRFRSEFRKAHGPERESLAGVYRHIVVADSDEEALRLGRAAWEVFYESFIKLWRRHGGEPKNAKLPPTLDPMIASGNAVVGSPGTVRNALLRQVEATGVNYLGGSFAFGDLPYEATCRSIDLYASEVMPFLRAAFSRADSLVSAVA
jgi:alkanesulfonate monooxygenase SsuD/methylene tetrahydromethanopterin reductase-like flavin-dependent oxidoreductase (luciferase family)